MKDEDLKRFKNLRENDMKDFEAAQAEATKPWKSALPGVAAGVASAGVKKRALPKMLQIKKKDAAGEEEDETFAKRPRADGDRVDAPPSLELASKTDESCPPAREGLLAGYGSGSSEEEEDDD